MPAKKKEIDPTQALMMGTRAYQLEKKEAARLRKLYKKIPANKYSLVQGLIQEAARLRARCDLLWEDIVINGETEEFSQSEDAEPYDRERPASRIYTASNKAYCTIISKLDGMLPAEIPEEAATFEID